MKRVLSAILCFLIVFARILQGEEFTTLDGELYTGATLKRVEPDGLVIAYSDGIVKLKFKNLSLELCQKYGYSPESEKAYLQKRHDDEIKSEEQAKSHSPIPPDTQISAPSIKNKQLDKAIEIAAYNCAFIKKRITALESEISSQNSESGSKLFIIRNEETFS